MHRHHWSGWPGATCLKCGTSDAMELAIADGSYDPFTDAWVSPEAYDAYQQASWCSVADRLVWEDGRWCLRETVDD
jgi:hypothetical protein